MNFKKRMGELNLSPKQKKDICCRLGVTLSAVNDWINPSGIYPSTKKLIALAEYLNCSLDYLVGLSDIPTPADVAGVRLGRWIKKDEQMIVNLDNARAQYEDLGYAHRIELVLQCSVCRMVSIVDNSITYSYCPHCGAMMDEEDEE